VKRALVIVAVIVVVAILGFFGYRQFLSPAPATPTPAADALPQPRLPQLVSAEAFVVPKQKAELAFQANGQIISLPAVEGKQVSAGETLGQIEATNQEMAVRQAQAAVRQAEASVTQAAANVESAKAGLVSAQAQLAQVKAGPTSETIAQAKAAVQTAKARLNQVAAAARPEDIESAASSLLKAEAALRQAQTEYDKVAWADEIGESPQAVALEQATLDYQAAEASYERVLNGATQEEIDIAQAQVAEAEAALAAAQAGATPEEIAIAEAGVLQAEEGVTQAEAALSVSEAGLESAQASLEQAQKMLEDYTLLAPFNGNISRVSVETGEFVAAGSPVISLSDDSAWYVETDDLSEIDVVQVAAGQKARVTVDALPGEEFEGEVTDIAPRSETKRGDVTYTVTIILPDAENSPLRWGMTAFVDIEVGD
jgi:HlyD family secretion protein